MKKPIEMTEITIPRQLAKDIHFELDGKLKEKLGEYLPKEKLQLGRWIKDDKYPKWMMFYTDETIAYGFNVSGKWEDASSPYNNPVPLNSWDGNRYATEEEIIAHFKPEIKRRGYRAGVTCLFGKRKVKNKIYSDDVIYVRDGDIYLGFDAVLYNGQWAELVHIESRKIGKIIGIIPITNLAQMKKIIKFFGK